MKWIAVVVLVGCGRVDFDVVDGGVPAPIARYTMDGDPAGGVVDASGHGHDGTCATCPTVVPAVNGGGYAFTGAELIRVPFAPDLDAAPGVSAAAWVKPAIGGGCVVGQLYGTALDNTWQLCLNGGLGVFGCVHGACDSKAAYMAGAWRQLVLVADGATLRVWIGGELVAETPAVLAPTKDAGDLVIGADLDNGVPMLPFHGVLDDVRIWNRALTDAERALVIAP
jgi:large repetitive protein